MVDVKESERKALETYAREQLKSLGFTEEQLKQFEKKDEIIRVYGEFLIGSN